jgi:hypothetical protein
MSETTYDVRLTTTVRLDEDEMFVNEGSSRKRPLVVDLIEVTGGGGLYGRAWVRLHGAPRKKDGTLGADRFSDNAYGEWPPVVQAAVDAHEAMLANVAALAAGTIDGETARKWAGEHFHQLKGAVADGLNGARVGDCKISPERSQQLATLAMARMAHVYPPAPWADEIAAAVGSFLDGAPPAAPETEGGRPG